MKNPIFDPQLNTNRLDVSDVKEMPAWMEPVLDFINRIAETIYFAQEFDLEAEILSKIPATKEDAVTSVNTKTGAVTLDTDDIPEGITNKYLTEDPILNSIKAASSSGLSIKSSTDTEIFKIEDTGQLKAVYESTVGTDYNTTLHNIYGARAWINFNGVSDVIRASGNVSSIVHNDVGDYTINFTTALPDADYNVVHGTRISGSPGSLAIKMFAYYSGGWIEEAPTTGGFRIGCSVQGAINQANGDYIMLAVFR